MFYPVYLNLEGRRVVVIGGGKVAERKVASLEGTGASITVISPEVTSLLGSLARTNGIEWHRRSYRQGDCENAALVLSATDDPATDQAVWEEGNRLGVLVNTADQPGLCDFIMPAVVRRAALIVAISTGGISPALAARLRQEISDMLGPEYEGFLDLLAAVRPEIQQRIESENDRKTLHYRLVDSDILSLLEKDDTAGAERRLREIIEEFSCRKNTS